MAEEKKYDLVIIGGGPAGLTAGLYASRAKINSVLLERALAGGQVAGTGFIENYPGVRKISGAGLAQQMEDHAKEFGLNIELAEVRCIRPCEDRFGIETDSGIYKAHSIILTTGVHSKLLNIPGEKELKGRGVSYCAICDGFFYNGKHVAVIGGGDSAVEEGVYLAKFADKVTIIHRRDSLRAQKIIQERAFANPRIEFMWNSVPVEINAGVDGFVNGLTLKNMKTEDVTKFPIDGVFIYIGTVPDNYLCDLEVDTDEMGFIVTDERMHTSIPGLFAAGDVRSKRLRQIVTAVSDGAVAAISASDYLESLEEIKQVGG